MNVTHPHANQQTTHADFVRQELEMIRAELAGLRERFDDFAAVYLAAKFPYGKPIDRWRTRR